MVVMKSNQVMIAIAILAVSVAYADIDSSLDYFLVSDGSTLKSTDSLFNQEEIFETQTNDVITAFGNYYNEIFFWTKYSHDLNLDLKIEIYTRGRFSSYSQIRPWKPNSIAVDYLNKKLYVIDELAAKINMFDIKNDRYSIILSDLRKPRNLALDCSMSVMFFSQSDSAIYRANLDGTNLTKVIDKQGITAVAVDPTASPYMLYWAAADGTIETSDYFGSKRMVILGLEMRITSLAVSNGSRVAWISPATWTSGESKLYIYEDIAGSGGVRLRNATFKDPRIIRHFVKTKTNIRNSNPCDDDNGGCQHFCLLNANKEASCACQIGWQLDPNFKTCRPITEFLLYTQGEFIRGKSLDAPEREAFTDAIIPIQLSSDFRLGYRVIDFDYDLETGSFLYTSHNRIYVENVLDAKERSVFKYFEDDPGLKSVAVDWVTGNVYLINDRHIMVYNHRRDNFIRKTVYLRIRYRTHSLVVHPDRGYLFFISAGDRNGDSRIYRINADLDHASMEVIAEEQLNGLNATKFGVALDYEEDRLYQLCGTTVRHSNLDGRDVQTIDVSVVHDPRSIAIYKDWMYLANQTSIWRLHKLSGDQAVRIAPKYGESLNEPISGVKIYSNLLQKVDYERNPCAVNNGDCERFCFVVPDGHHEVRRHLKKVCDCGSQEHLQFDGTSCLSVK